MELSTRIVDQIQGMGGQWSAMRSLGHHHFCLLFFYVPPPPTHQHSKSVALHMAFKKTGQYHI